ncbi:MAG: winged helix-turn-helix domain-containing protein [Dokdonella sp.]|uniref:winged helix-turn-helix domain-containing protein n=1 Tax=Dokdonella sp. TaxID=2291710 RepID=UPI003BB0F0CB
MVELPRPATSYRFSDWCYEPARRLLSGPGGATRLKPLLDRLLRRFLDEPDAVLARERLIEDVWTRREVNDEVLSRAIGELRGVLGDDARQPVFIETLPKGGYRWVAQLTRIDADAGRNPLREQNLLERSGRSRAYRVIAVFGGLACVAAATAWLIPRNDRSDRDRASLAAGLLGARPLATDPRLEIDPRFDPHGRVVYVRANQHDRSSELVMIDPASHAERVIWQDADALRRPAPSPDGREIAVTRRTASGCELWSIALLDNHRTRLGDCAGSVVGALEWVDGGTALLYTGDAVDSAHAPGLRRLERRSGASTIVTNPAISEGAHVDPRVSTDSRNLVYASQPGDERRLWWTDWPRLGQREALLKRPEPLYGHAFEPDGKALWAAGDLTLYRALHRLRRGAAPELIGGRGAQSIDIAANGAAVWSEASYDADIWLQREAGSAWTTIARSNRYESQPEFSADGRYLALVSNRNGSESILVHDLDSGSTRPLALDPTSRWVRPSWSARDQSLILTAYEDKRTRLYRYPLSASHPTALPGIEDGAFQGIELADSLLYLNGHGTDHGTLMQRREGASQSENLGLGAVSAYRASPGWIAWRTPASPHLHAAPWPALNPVRQVERKDAGSLETMALTANQLYYVDQGKLWTVHLPDGTPTEVTLEHPPNGSGPDFSVSPQGAIASVTLTSVNMDLMIAFAPTRKP